MKKLIILFFVLFVNITYADCTYKSDFDKCKKALDAWTQKTLEFACVKWDDEKIYTQIILDEKFRWVDNKVVNYLTGLENDKDKYFWEKSQLSLFDAVNEIENKFAIDWPFAKKYFSFCEIGENTIYSEVLSCLWTLQTTNSLKYFSQTRCNDLIERKMSINKHVAYNILKMNKKQIEKDSKKTFQQETRKSFNALHEVIMKNIWYLTKILKSWTVKTKNVYTG